jgi:hypothetical protein
MELAIQAVQALKRNEANPNLIRYDGFRILKPFPPNPPTSSHKFYSLPSSQRYLYLPVVITPTGPTLQQQITLRTSLLGDWFCNAPMVEPIQESPVYLKDAPIYLTSILLTMANSPLTPCLTDPLQVYQQVLTS